MSQECLDSIAEALWEIVAELRELNGKKIEAPPSRKTREALPKEAQDMVNWNPDKVTWDKRESKNGTVYEEAPVNDGNPDFVNMRKAVQINHDLGKKYLFSGGLAYRVIDNGRVQRFKRKGAQK